MTQPLLKIDYYWSLEFKNLLDKENKRVGFEWENLKDESQIFNLIDKQSERFLKTFKRFECDS